MVGKIEDKATSVSVAFLLLENKHRFKKEKSLNSFLFLEKKITLRKKRAQIDFQILLLKISAT